MQNITVNLRLRPIRFAFIVRPDDEKHILEIFQINACLWGGKFNPIIPSFKEVPDWWDRYNIKYETAEQIINGYLDFYEPDFIVEAEPGLANDYGFDSHRVIQLKDVLSSEGHYGEGGYGCRVTELYEHLYNKSFQYQRRHKNNILYVTTQQKSLENFVACIFGMYSAQENLKYVEDVYKKTFDPEVSELNIDFLISFYESTQNVPIEMGCYNIGIYYHDHSSPILFFVDLEKPQDLIDYWNLRTIYINVFAIPIQWFQELLPFCKRFILKNFRPLFNNPEGGMMRTTLIFSRSLTVTWGDEIINKSFQEELKESKIISESYPFMWQDAWNPIEKRATLEIDKTTLNVPFVDDNFPYNINTLTPEFGKNTRSTFFKWANIIQLQDSSHKDEIATVFPSEYRKQMTIKPYDQFVHMISTTEGLVYLTQYNSSLAMLPITNGGTAIQNWLHSRGVENTVFSDAGRVTEQIIKTLSGFQGVRSLANKDIVTLFNDISKKPLKSMHAPEFKSRIESSAVKNKVPYDVFESLVKNKAVELGSEIRCRKCDQWSWYSIKQLDYQLTCNFCLQCLEFPITHVGDSNSLRYSYRVVGAFALNNFANGGYAAALTIRFFGQIYSLMSRSKIVWSSGQEITLANGKKVEADFILWCQQRLYGGSLSTTELVFGEAKSFAKDAFTQKDIDKMKLLAEAFPGSYLVFATLKEELSQEEVNRIKELAEWAQVYDQDRSQPRARIIVLTGLELFTDWFVVQTWKDKGGKHKELLGDSWATINRMNLEYLADVTQRLYLVMSSPS